MKKKGIKLSSMIYGARVRIGRRILSMRDTLGRVYAENSGGMTVGAMCGALMAQLMAVPALAANVVDTNGHGVTSAEQASEVMSGLSTAAGGAVYASGDIFDRAVSLMSGIYGSIARISTVTAAVTATVCIFMMIFTKNEQAVQESIQWLKRIVICWAAIMLMALIVRFLTNGLGISADQAITDFQNLGN